MLESVNDLVSLAVMIAMVLAGFYFLFIVMDRNHGAEMQKREDMYYRLYEELDDDNDDDDDPNDPYYE